MAATRTFDPGLVFDDTTLTPSISATGQLLDVAGGTPQAVYDLLGNPLTGNLLTTNSKGYLARFKAGIDFGVVVFGSVIQPVVSIEALQSGPAAAQAAVDAANALAQAQQAVTAANSAANSAFIAQQAAEAAALTVSQGGGGGGLPANVTLEQIPNGTTRVAMTSDERAKLSNVPSSFLVLGTTASTAMAGNKTFTPAQVGAPANVSGFGRVWGRTAGQALPTAAEGAQEGDWAVRETV